MGPSFIKNKGRLYIIIPLFFLLYGIYCSPPYLYLLRKFSVPEQTRKQFASLYEDEILYVKSQNPCVEYQLIFSTPLLPPFLPKTLEYPDESEPIALIQDYFFWIRIYLKNTGETPISFYFRQFYLLIEKEKIFPIPIKDVLFQYPILLYEKPIFWYMIPKNPILYFQRSTKWFRTFYTLPVSYSERKIKMLYYSQYFQNFLDFTLNPQEETLFFLPFSFFQEMPHQIYHFHIESKNPDCRIRIPFYYQIEASKESETIKKGFFRSHFRNYMTELKKQNSHWIKKRDQELKKHDYDKN